MRFGKNRPKVWTTKTVTKFLWWPKTITPYKENLYGGTRWLEKATILYTFLPSPYGRLKGYWYEEGFVD